MILTTFQNNVPSADLPLRRVATVADVVIVRGARWPTVILS